jgi:hypothetical protein
MMTRAKPISDIRVTSPANSVCATVKGRKVTGIAESFGVRIGRSRYWFTMDKWASFLEYLDRDAKQD